MKIDHVHFYVDDAIATRDWFVNTLGFEAVAGICDRLTQTELIKSGTIVFALSSPLSSASPIAAFLRQHPPGVADIAFQVSNLEALMAKAIAQGAKVLQPMQQQAQPQGQLKWAQIQAWGSLRHTLLERSGVTTLLPLNGESDAGQGRLPLVFEPAYRFADSQPNNQPNPQGDRTPEAEKPMPGLPFAAIDHAVLNVGVGELQRAVSWYQSIFGFRPQQAFNIQTDFSGLKSQVLVHPDAQVQLPINEPASKTSQIQEFLEINRGAGIQHIALRTSNIVAAIAELRPRGLSLLPVPETYYEQLCQRPGFQLSAPQWQAIAAQQVLVDWQNDRTPALLLQTFTQPIFSQPTFFFELIERQVYCSNGQRQQAQGFGEGNFQALFEAVEREQMKRSQLVNRKFHRT